MLTKLKSAVNVSTVSNRKVIKLTKREVFNLVGIGFCQPKFYKRSVWLKAKHLMDSVVCKAGLSYPHDFGFGKGKYESNRDMSIDQIKQKVCDILEDQGRLILNPDQVVVVELKSKLPTELTISTNQNCIRTVTITDHNDNVFDVPVFSSDRKHEIDTTKYEWLSFDVFQCNQLIREVVER